VDLVNKREPSAKREPIVLDSYQIVRKYHAGFY
jgi:hypothetical protein